MTTALIILIPCYLFAIIVMIQVIRESHITIHRNQDVTTTRLWAFKIQSCINLAKNYEHICSCGNLLHNFRMMYPYEKADYEALEIMLSVKTDWIKAMDKKTLIFSELDFTDEG